MLANTIQPYYSYSTFCVHLQPPTWDVTEANAEDPRDLWSSPLTNKAMWFPPPGRTAASLGERRRQVYTEYPCGVDFEREKSGLGIQSFVEGFSVGSPGFCNSLRAFLRASSNSLRQPQFCFCGPATKALTPPPPPPWAFYLVGRHLPPPTPNTSSFLFGGQAFTTPPPS